MQPDSTALPLLSAATAQSRPNTVDSGPESITRANLSELRAEPTVSMALRSEAISERADIAIKNLAFYLYEKASLPTRPTKKYLAALAAAIADLLKAGSHDPIRACYRPMTVADFTDHGIGYRPFRRVIDHLEARRFIKVIKGEVDPNAVLKKAGIVTRIRPTPKLFDFLALRGITVADRAKHFVETRPVRVGELIRLKATKPISRRPLPGSGRPMPVDMTNPKVIAYSDEVRRMNEYLGKQLIEGAEFNGLFRGFNLGDDSRFDWNKGGRLYAFGGSYQNASKEERLAMRINGQRVVEIDISASHLTILHSLLGVPLPGKDDLCDGIGVHRDIAKAWVANTLGYGQIPQRWSGRARKFYAKFAPGRTFQKDYPVGKIGELVLTHFPLINTFLEGDLCWADFQFVESNVICDTLLSLMNNDIPALPVHDSIIIDYRFRLIGIDALRSSFHKVTGLNPFLK